MKRIITILVTILFVLVFFVGSAFRIMHWPWGTVIYYAGMAGTGMMLLLILITNLGKKEEKDALDKFDE